MKYTSVNLIRFVSIFQLLLLSVTEIGGKRLTILYENNR